jgi:hypothetical protein
MVQALSIEQFMNNNIVGYLMLSAWMISLEKNVTDIQ